MPESVSASWSGDGVTRARFDRPTTRCAHEVPGDPTATIPGGIGLCGSSPDIISADGGWIRVIPTRLTRDGRLAGADLGARVPGALNAALACRAAPPRRG